MPVIGTRQSPIKISTKSTLKLAEPQKLLSLKYQNKNYLGDFVPVSKEHGNLELRSPFPTILFKGETFELRKIHIHKKAEHLIDSDKPSDYEVHFLHLKKGADLSSPKVVIGILYHEKSKHGSGRGLEQIHESLTTLASANKTWRNSKGGGIGSGINVNPLNFFPRLGNNKPDLENWFHYEGSLTSEPYSEDVSWFVMKNEAAVDPKNTSALEDIAEQHARPVYSIDNRIIVRSF